MITNIYANIPTEEKIKLYLRFYDYLTKEPQEQEQGGKYTSILARDTIDNLGI